MRSFGFRALFICESSLTLSLKPHQTLPVLSAAIFDLSGSQILSQRVISFGVLILAD
jgi:hypothetical protein